MEYDGFISYSHAVDGRLAPAVQRGLQQLARRWNRRQALRIFRDETGLSTNPDLWGSIVRSIDASRWFVLMASPEAATSPWVERELQRWLETKSIDTLLPVVTSGVWEWDPDTDGFTPGSDAVPAILLDVFSAEPRHLDMRWARDATDLDLRNPRFRDAIADLSAPIHGIAKDELVGEDIRQHRRGQRLARGAVAALVVLLAVAAVAGTLAVLARNDARQETYVAVLKGADATAVAEVERNPVRSLLVAAEVQRRLDSPSSRAALLATLVRTGPLARVRPLPFSSARVAVVSDDASRIVALDRRGRVHTVDVGSGESRVLRTGLHDPITQLAISSDGSLAAIGDRRGRVAFVGTASGATPCPVLQLARGPITRLALVGAERAVVGQEGPNGMVWRPIDLDSCRPGRSWISDQRFLGLDNAEVVVSPDASSVALPALPIEIRSADLTEQIRSVAPVAVVKAVAFTPDGRELVVAAPDALHVVDLATGAAARAPIALPRLKADRITVAPDGSSVAVRLEDGTTDLVDLSTGASSQEPLIGSETPPLDEAFTPDGRTLAAVSSTEVVTWDLEQLAPIASASFAESTADVAFGPEDRTVLAGAQDGATHALRVRRAGAPDVFARHRPGAAGVNLGVTSISTSKGGRLVASVADTDDLVLIASGRTGRPLGKPIDVPGGPASVALSPLGDLVAVTTRSKDVVLIERTSGRERWRARLDVDTSLRASPIVFSSDGGRLITTDRGGIVVLGASDGRIVRSSVGSRALGLAVSPRGDRIAAATSDGTVLILDAGAQRRLDTLASPDVTIQDVAFVPGTSLLLAAGRAGSMQIWDVPTSRLLGSVPAPRSAVGILGASALAVTHDDSLAAVAYHPGGVVLWQLDPDAWRRAACKTAGRNLTRSEWTEAFGSVRYHQTC